MDPPERSVGGLLGVFDRSLRLGLLPSHLFPSGHVFFIQRQVRAQSRQH